ncbi:MAG TPA: ABC transporter permease [Methylomirabilota bacterium]
MSTLTTPAHSTLLRAHRGWRPLDLAELWRYRELLAFLALRELQVRYRQMALGAAWAIIQPLLTMVVFTVFFGYLGGFRARSDKPYAVLTFCALLPWQLFATALAQSGNSLVANERLITKVYFPRLIVPVAPVVAGLVDFAIGLLVLLGMMLVYGLTPHWGILLLPAFVVFAVLAALAPGVWLAALNVEYRDVRATIPFLTQFWLFITPIAYPITMVPERWRTLYAVNPMVGVVEGFRWAILGAPHPPVVPMLVSAAVTAVLLTGGLYFFRRMETTFADRV